jgi:hypothetical protein
VLVISGENNKVWYLIQKESFIPAQTKLGFNVVMYVTDEDASRDISGGVSVHRHRCI